MTCPVIGQPHVCRRARAIPTPLNCLGTAFTRRIARHARPARKSTRCRFQAGPLGPTPISHEGWLHRSRSRFHVRTSPREFLCMSINQKSCLMSLGQLGIDRTTRSTPAKGDTCCLFRSTFWAAGLEHNLAAELADATWHAIVRLALRRLYPDLPV